MSRFLTRSYLKRTGLFMALIMVVTMGWFGWRVYAATASATGNKNPLQLLRVFTPTQLKETNGRVNILVAGYSTDDPDHSGANLTDSIMTLSVNQTTNKATVISVPRDLWVDVPGYGYQKINAAYEEGGIPLLEQIIQQDLGVGTNYYDLINYTAVKDAVNAVGGITVDIQSSDPRGLYDPYTNLNLSNGIQTIDGQTALDLARARGDDYGSYGFANGDFDRMKNQQMILLALKDKAGSTAVIVNPFKVANIVSSVGDNLRTDMSLGEIETLYSISKKVSDTSTQAINLNSLNGQNLLASYTNYDGQEALIPAAGIDDFTQIQTALAATLQ